MNGRPVLGVISGFLFGLFTGLSLFMWGVIAFHSPLLWILPLVGIVLGLVMAAWAPFGKVPAPAAAAGTDATATAPETATTTDTAPQNIQRDDQANEDAGSDDTPE